MKRNTIFIWAYITFIGISIILKFFYDYSLWAPIVIAITFSSMFFSIEDFFSLLYRTQKKSCDITENFVIEAKQKEESVLEFFDVINETYNKYKNSEYDITELQEYSASPKKRTQEVIELITELEKANLKDRKKEKNFKIMSYIFAYIGFLFLFISLIIPTLISISPLIQEIITVISFAIILITQQLNNYFIDKIEKENKENKELLQKIVTESDQWADIKERFEGIIERIEKDEFKTEVKYNAD